MLNISRSRPFWLILLGGFLLEDGRQQLLHFIETILSLIGVDLKSEISPIECIEEPSLVELLHYPFVVRVGGIGLVGKESARSDVVRQLRTHTH